MIGFFVGLYHWICIYWWKLPLHACEHDISVSPTGDMGSTSQPAWFTDFNEKLDKTLQFVDQKLETLTNIERSVSKLENSLQKIEKLSIPAIEKSISDVQDTLDEHEQAQKEADEKILALENKVSDVESENARLSLRLKETSDKLLYQESQSKRNNLIFHGIQETPKETWEDIETKVRNVLETEMGIDDVDDIAIERAHRTNYGKKEGQPRPVIVKFLSFKDREAVFKEKLHIQNKAVMVFEDYPLEIQRNRQQLWPIYKTAKVSEEFTTVSLKLDKLYINNKQYTTANLCDLPKSLLPENRSIKQTDQLTVFYSKHSVFSNFHALDVDIEGIRYCCNEKYFQRAKALHFGDDECAAKIMTETDPHKISDLGKKVRGYKKELWEKQAEKVLRRVNHAKYLQHPHAKQALLDTEDREIGEASPDPFYGIGIRLSAPQVTQRHAWTGQNVMGKILQEVRGILKDA